MPRWPGAPGHFSRRLDQAVPRPGQRLAPGPHRPLGHDLAHVQGFPRADRHGPADRLDVQHVARLATPAGTPTRSPLRCPTVNPYAPRAGRPVPRPGHDAARRLPAGRRGPGVVLLREADIVASGAGHRHPACGGLGPASALVRHPAGTWPGPAALVRARPARRTGPCPWSTLRLNRRPSSKRAWCPVQTASKPSATARSSTAANLIFSLQRRQGLGVRPWAYSATKSSTTSRRNRSAMSHT